MDTGRTSEDSGSPWFRLLADQRAIDRHLRRARQMRAAAMARLFDRIFDGAARLRRAVGASLAEWQRQGATYHALMGCSDRLLADIGIEREDIPRIAKAVDPPAGNAKRDDVADAGGRARAPRGRPGPPPAAATPRALNLALQGGGAHGAFTWGALDRLLEDDRITFEGVSGTSAGAVNAVLLVSGWLAEGRSGARRALDTFWDRLANLAPPDSFQPTLGLLTETLSPYQLNPLDLNPLRSLLAELVDFEAIRKAEQPRLFVAATGVRTGECRVFRNHEMSVDAVLASACLPQLQQAVRVDGEWFWDGGFSSNPPLLPLVEHGRARDLLLIQLTPSAIAELPTSAPDIRRRLNQIVFNGPLLHELRALELWARPAPVRLHRIDATPDVVPLAPESAQRPSRDLLLHLRERGREAADRWLRTLTRPTATGARAA